MTDLSNEQRTALDRARGGADLEMAGRRARDRAILDAKALGLSERQIAEGVGRNVDGSLIVSLSSIHRVKPDTEENP